MAKLLPPASTGGLTEINVTNNEYREQMSILVDAMRQLAGNAMIEPGQAVVNDPLNAPYVMYVNPYTGSDAFAGGSYASADDMTFEQKVKRIENQRLTCGYTPFRPFKSINRAAIEAGIVTSKTFMNLPERGLCGDLVSIVLAPGFYRVFNDPGGSAPVIQPWNDGHEPTTAELIAFNPASGGVILPRGASLCGADLRKTFLMPNYVPPAADMQRVVDPVTREVTYTNFSQILRMTGNGYYFGFSFIDNRQVKASHHLLKCFGYASEQDLIEFYNKINTAVGGAGNPGNVDPVLLAPRASEHQLVGPRPDSNPTADTDTTGSSSPYIFNVSIRSNYGLSGLFMDGALATGWKSTVLAQFTGVSLQRDTDCWEIYDPAAAATPGHESGWRTPLNYNELVSIAVDPDSIRFKPARRSIHIHAINGAFAQLVSVFAIGQSVHHFTENGGELTITNSNSNFGGVSALSDGFRKVAFPIDKGWNISSIRTMTDLSNRTGNVKRVVLGTVAQATANNATTIVLQDPLARHDTGGTPAAGAGAVPEILGREGYSLRAGSLLWVDNPNGNDWRATVAAVGWDPTRPAELLVTAAFTNEDGQVPGGEGLAGTGENAVGTPLPSLAGRAVYVRRLVDTRTVEMRRTALRLVNTGVTRTPLRDFVMQVDTAQSTIIASQLPEAEPILVTSAGKTRSRGGTNYEVTATLRRACDSEPWAPDHLYRPGDSVLFANKHYNCVEQHLSEVTLDALKFSESFVHMSTAFRAEGNARNEAPIVVFDNDTDAKDITATCGWDFKTAWQTNEIARQYRTGADYRGAYALMRQLGFTQDQAHEVLRPRPEAVREYDPVQAGIGSSGAVIQPPNGAAKVWANWPVQFHRPSVIRLFGQAWEWAGFGNYSRALPTYQGEMSPQNKITYFFTSANGGRVYGTGFNEDGYAVSPSGLTDISTGQVLSVDQIGRGDSDLEFPTTWNNVSVADITVRGNANVAGTLRATRYEGLPIASVTNTGGVEIAEQKEVEDAFNGFGLGSSNNPLARRVVDLAGIVTLKTSVLNEVRLLEKKFCRIYIDGGVKVNYVTSINGSRERVVSNVPLEIWKDMSWNAGFHEMTNGFIPANPTQEALNFANTVVFQSFDQALDFLNDRTPSVKTPVIFHFYGSNEYKGGKTQYLGDTEVVWQRGPSYNPPSTKPNDRSLDRRCGTIYLSGVGVQLGKLGGVPWVQLTDLDVSSGTMANPTRLDNMGINNGGWPDDSTGVMALWNCKFTNRTDAFYMTGCLLSNKLDVHQCYYWSGPGEQRTWNSDVEYYFFNKPNPGAPPQNWDCFWYGNVCVIWPRRGVSSIPSQGANLPMGSRKVLMELSTDYSQSPNSGKKPFIIFRTNKQFIYNNWLSDPPKTGEISCIDLVINLKNFEPSELHFISQHQPTGVFQLMTIDILVPIQPDPNWVLQEEKRTRVTINDDLPSRILNTKFCQVSVMRTSWVYITAVSGPNNNDMNWSPWGTLTSLWALAIRKTYGPEKTPFGRHVVLQWTAGSPIADDFRLKGAFVDAWNLRADSERPNPALLAARANPVINHEIEDLLLEPVLVHPPGAVRPVEEPQVPPGPLLP